jgi:hypothetical protein
MLCRLHGSAEACHESILALRAALWFVLRSCAIRKHLFATARLEPARKSRHGGEAAAHNRAPTTPSTEALGDVRATHWFHDILPGKRILKQTFQLPRRAINFLLQATENLVCFKAAAATTSRGLSSDSIAQCTKEKAN